MIDKWKQLFCYGGLSKEEYESILPDIHQQNQRNLQAYCAIVAALLGVSIVGVLAVHAFTASTAAVYFLGFAFSLLVLFLTRYTERHAWLVSFLKYAFVSAIYVFGILVTMAQPESLAVAFMVMLVLVPLLFSGRPSVMAVFTAGAAAAFAVCELALKDPALVGVDIGNAVTYGLLGVLVGTIVQQVRLQNLIQLRKIAILSESDLLTGLKNRNSFEQNLTVYGKNNINCVYADVNGLHEVNNTQGHQAGDLMLKTVAEAILDQFGRAHSYRVGGDEFVVFTFGQAPDETKRRVDKVNRMCLEKGYHVSFGVAGAEIGTSDLDSLVRSAEEKMYRAKSEYYRNSGLDRRRR